MTLASNKKRYPLCKECAKGSRLRYWRKASQREKRSYLNRKKDYGLTPDQLHEMLLSQGETCAICPRTIKIYSPDSKKNAANVDHCHETGKVRGLLCLDCNVGIGRLGDSPHLVASALEYLRSHANA